MTTMAMKYRHVQLPTVRIASYITAFQSSPVSTWKMVMNDQKKSSKWCRGRSATPRRA